MLLLWTKYNHFKALSNNGTDGNEDDVLSL